MHSHERRNLKRGVAPGAAKKAAGRDYRHHEDSALAFSVAKHGAIARGLTSQSANIVTRPGGRRK